MKIKYILLSIIIIILSVGFLFLYVDVQKKLSDNVEIETDKTCDNFGINIKEGINNLNEQSEFCNKICNELNKDNLGSKCNFRKEVIKCYCG